MAGADFNPNVSNPNIKPAVNVNGQAPVNSPVLPKTSQVDTVAISSVGSRVASPQELVRAVAHEVGSFGLSPAASKLLFGKSTAA